MSDTAAGDGSFRRSVIRHVASAVGLIVFVAAVFWVIGSLGGDDGTPVVTSPPPTGDTDDTEQTDGTDDGPDDEDTPDDPADPPDGDADDDEVPGDDEDADDDAVPDEPAADPIDPATISVQVLDGYQQDGGAAANVVAQQLSDEGYDIVARNPALRYEVTTVLWTAGFEDEGRQVAAAIDAAEAREQPGNLSEAVAVHVVVGADRG